MKSWILLFVISAAAIGVLGFNLKEASETCFKKHHTNEQAIRDDKYVKPSDDPELKCYYACMAKKKGWMSEKGDVISHKLLAKPISEIPKEHRPLVEQILQTCVKRGKNDCETAYFVYKCLDAKMGNTQ